MKKFLSSVFVALTLTGSSYALTDIQACINQFHAGNYQEAVQYGQKAVREYPNNPKAYFCLGRAYAKTGQTDKAIESLKKASEYTSDDHDLMYIYNWLGMEYVAKVGDFNGFLYASKSLNNALFYYSKSLKLAKRFGNIDIEEADLNNIANIFFIYKDNYSKALEYYKKALELGKPKRGTIYNNIAWIYFDMHNYKKAIEYLKKALNIDEENGHYLSSGADMLNLGNLYRKTKDFKDAKFYLEKGLERVKKVGNEYLEEMGYEDFSLYYRDLGNKALAKEYLTKALEILQR
ncbi:MAG: tetratricopeptide repeat protein [Nanopusillaceae archaeon]